MGRNSLLLLASSIRFYSGLELLPRPKRHNPAGANWNFPTGFRIPSRPLVFVAQFKVAEAGEFDLLAPFQRTTELLEKGFDELFGFTFIEAELFVKALGHLCLGQSHGTGFTPATGRRNVP